VLGDDLLDRADEIRDRSVTEMFSGVDFPDDVWSMNAYLGAGPIATALDGGAEIVITGRCTDSGVALGPLMHNYGWSDDDWDKLSQGSLGYLLSDVICDWPGVTLALLAPEEE